MKFGFVNYNVVVVVVVVGFRNIYFVVDVVDCRLNFKACLSCS